VFEETPSINFNATRYHSRYHYNRTKQQVPRRISMLRQMFRQVLTPIIRRRARSKFRELTNLVGSFRRSIAVLSDSIAILSVALIAGWPAENVREESLECCSQRGMRNCIFQAAESLRGKSFGRKKNALSAIPLEMRGVRGRVEITSR